MRRLLFMVFLAVCALHVYAQDVPAVPEDGELKLNLEGVTFDFGPTLARIDLAALPLFSTDYTKDFFEHNWPKVTFRFRPDAAFTGSPSVYGIYNNVSGDAMSSWHGMTYNLGSQLHLTLYGEYDSDGYKRTTVPAVPWRRNDFNAGFQIKTADGKFGFRMQLQRSGQPW